jgi:hypothetical protein
MILSNFEQTSAISQLCKEILASNENIYFVSSINKNGKVIELEFRNDRIISNMTKQQREMFFMQRTLQTSLTMEFDGIIGPLNFITLHRETFLELLFPYSQGIIFVTCDLNVIPRYIAKKILFILQDFEWNIKNIVSEYV